jgi:two-component system, OmpR family, sensor kinase
MSVGARIRRFRFPLTVLLIALAATGLAATLMSRAIHAVDRQRFELAVDGLHDRIIARLDTYMGMLRAGAGVAGGADMLSAEEFTAFTDQLDLRERYPGIQGIGFTARITPDRLAAVIAAQRQSGDETFRVWPEQPRDEYHAILYLSPLDRRNREAIGFDMFTEPTRREAMARARDTGEPAASGSVQLVQEIDEEDRQPGFLIYMPVYEGRGVPDTVEARRSRLRGFIYSPFRAHDLFLGILGRNPNPRAGFALFDGEPGSSTLLYETGGDDSAQRFRITRSLDVAGRTWTTVMFSSGAFERSSSMGFVPWVAWGGIAVSCLLAWVVWLQTRARERAEMFRARAEEAVEHLRKAERSLQAQARTAERISRVKDEFLTTLSHELRTPLNAVLGWSHMLNGMDLDEDRRREAVGVIFRNAQIQAKLVDDLLDMSRIITGRLRLEMQPVDLRDIIRAAIDVVRPTADAKRVRVQVDAGPAEVPVMGDSARLQQVLWNLLTNAIKFTPAEGSVTVRVTPGSDQVTLSVTDTGAGIRADFLPHVFERFRQGEARTAGTHGGLGIGLSIARSLIEMHAGSIRVESPGENAGATFSITLPLNAAESPLPETAG